MHVYIYIYIDATRNNKFIKLDIPYIPLNKP